MLVKVRILLVCLLVAGATYGADAPQVVEVDLGVDNPATPRTYAVKPGNFDFKLVNALPNTTYEIVGEKRRATGTEVELSKAAEKDDECAAVGQQLKRRLEAKLEAKKAKAPEADRPTVKLNEADIKELLQGDVGCKAELAKLKDDKATFEKDKKKLDDDQAKFDADAAKPAAEKNRLEAEKTRLDAEKKRLDALDSLANRDYFTLMFGGYSLKEGETLQKTFKILGEDRSWTVVVITQGGAAATTATAANKAANPIAADSPILNRLLNTTATHPDLIVGSCKYGDLACAARIYINADQISTLTITEIPRQGGVTVRVTGGEFFPCSAVSYNIAKYAEAPDTLILPLHMKKGFAGIGSLSINKAEAEAAAIYGLEICPGTNRIMNKTSWYVNDPSQEKLRDEYSTNKRLSCCDNLAYNRDPRLNTIKTPPIASLPLFLRGKSQVVEVEFDWDDGTHKTFTFPVVYQRFWLDAGGFFVFTRRTDQSIDLQNIGGTPEFQKVRAIRREVSIEPATGIVINVHPGNFPILAFQFGIAATQGKSPSYYGGLGIRAREIGKRGLATIGVGVAMQQEDHFPNIEYLGEYPSTSPRLKPVAKYGLTFPYVSFSLGFSFGGVSEKTNVADSPQAPQ
jgi:hypothetical protein